MAKMNLSAMEAGVLLLSPPFQPRIWTGAEQRAAHKLVKRGLLEQNDGVPSMFRQTPDGEKAVKALMGEDTQIQAGQSTCTNST